MRVFNDYNALKKALNLTKTEGLTTGFVPTMGALHLGHLSLINQAFKENDLVIVSIFINPTQFDNPQDFDKYPRTVEEDLKLLSGFEGNVLVFLPEVNDIYPNGIQSEHFEYGGIENQMEGKFRPGHFDGVGTVLKAFFSLLKPDTAYFGEKDFQQLQIVKKLVELENIPTIIVGCPILRTPSGLAMSSRNKRLTENQFEQSSLIYKALKRVKADFGIKNAKEIAQWVENAFASNPQLKLEYFEIAEESTLKPLTKIKTNKKYRAFIAVFAGEVRLIDNIALN